MTKRITKLINTSKNQFKDFAEIVFYKEPFEVTYGKMDKKTVAQRPRKFVNDGGDLPTPIGDATYNDLFESIKRSNRRAKDNFYGYGLCNRWDYFCTFTVSINDFESTDEATKYYWKLFKKKLQYRFPDIKILAVPERHKKGNLHFHALLGNCNLDNLLAFGIVKYGKQIYNLPLWDKGFSTVVKIENPNVIETQLKAVAYFVKYLAKEDRITYNQKKYYRTNNLDFKTKELSLSSLNSIEKSINKDDILFTKETNQLVVFRVKAFTNPSICAITDTELPW